MSWIVQVVSLAGAGLVLGAYFALQRRRWTSTGDAYLWFNFLGALLLTGVAIVDRRIGFVLLESAWAAISAWAILGQRRRRPLGDAR
ncbi:MAG: hypothetical protein GTN83_22735 [Acidobacteria bacterium]|nr:hypothetical protein [Acidobacteriota bacterium]